jgi:hypothetical protein
LKPVKSLAEYRIISYDGNSVWFRYIDHNTGKRAEAEMDVLDFMGRLMMLIPKKHLRMFRRYGLYKRGENGMA